MDEELLNELDKLMRQCKPDIDEELEGMAVVDPQTGEIVFITHYKEDGKTTHTIRHKLTVNKNSYDFTLLLENQPEITITVNDQVEATIEVSDLICKHFDINKEFVKDTIREQWREPTETLEQIGK